jgi:hypothetical protein
MPDLFATANLITGAPMASSGQLGVVDTVQQFPLGMRVSGTDAVGGYAEYVYLKGVASTIVGSVVTYDEAGVTALITATSVGPVAVATAITVASTFGWYGVTGTFPTDVVANCADNAKLGRETTNGKVGDSYAAGYQIMGAVSRAATTAAAVVNCQFNNPWVGMDVA